MKNKGFTLVELLIVVMLISILAGLLVSVINPQGIQQKARDSQRKADLKKIQTALELYFADERAYPNIAGPANTSTAAFKAEIVDGGYMNRLPEDPKNPGPGAANVAFGAAGNSGYAYTYIYSSATTRYVIYDRLEVGVTSSDPGWCDNLSNKNMINATIRADVLCYGVENP